MSLGLNRVIPTPRPGGMLHKIRENQKRPEPRSSLDPSGSSVYPGSVIRNTRYEGKQPGLQSTNIVMEHVPFLDDLHLLKPRFFSYNVVSLPVGGR